MSLRNLAQHIRSEEKGNGVFFLYLGLFLVICGFFGLAVDFALASHARNQAQSTLDSAVVAATTQLQTNKNTIDAPRAKVEAERFYATNRQNIAAIQCFTGSDLASAPRGSSLQPSPGKSCNWIKVSGGRVTSNPNQYQMSVQECTPTMFLTPFIKEFCYTLSSTARTAQSFG